MNGEVEIRIQTASKFHNQASVGKENLIFNAFCIPSMRASLKMHQVNALDGSIYNIFIQFSVSILLFRFDSIFHSAVRFLR